MDIYGLIGYPLGHSFSAGYFNEKFKAEGIDAEYVNFEIPSIDEFREVVEKNDNLKGLNVTIPYKEQVIPYLDELDKATAKRIGAVNVIKILRDSKKTKLIDELQGGTKVYEAVFCLGATTPSFDLETEIDKTFDISGIAEDDVRKALPLLRTQRLQRSGGVQERLAAVLQAAPHSDLQYTV